MPPSSVYPTDPGEGKEGGGRVRQGTSCGLGMGERNRTEQNLLDFSPPSQECGWQWDVPYLPASYAAAPGDTIRGWTNCWSDPWQTLHGAEGPCRVSLLETSGSHHVHTIHGTECVECDTPRLQKQPDFCKCLSLMGFSFFNQVFVSELILFFPPGSPCSISNTKILI